LKGFNQYVGLHGQREHRVLAQQWLGRVLDPREHIHHLDGDKANNHKSNLVMVEQPDHMRLHNGAQVRVMDMDGRSRQVKGRVFVDG
jgi:hypothetical protein